MSDVGRRTLSWTIVGIVILTVGWVGWHTRFVSRHPTIVLNSEDVRLFDWPDNAEHEALAFVQWEERMHCGKRAPLNTTTRLVFTYFEPLPTERDRHKILAQWKRSWQNAGWIPVVVDSRVAQKHWDYHRYLAAIQRLPTVNTRAYEDGCYLRWLAYEYALSQCGAHAGATALFSDYDVMNLRLVAPQNFPISCVLRSDSVPCLVSASFLGLAQFRLYLQFRGEALDANNREAISTHTSDMVLLHEHPSTCPFVPFYEVGDTWGAVGYRLPWWRNATTVHFSHHDTSQRGFLSQWNALQHEFRLAP